MREPTRRAFRNPWRWCFAFLVLSSFSFGLGAEEMAAAEAEPEAKSAEEATVAPELSTAPDLGSAPAPAFWSGLWVFIDPNTGELRNQPTEEQAAWRRSQQPVANPLLNKSSDGLVPFALEDGGRGVHLEGRFRHALVVKVAEDGSLTTHCSDHPEGHAAENTPAVVTDAEAPLQ